MLRQGPYFRLRLQEPTFFGRDTVRYDFTDDLIQEYKAIATSDGFEPDSANTQYGRLHWQLGEVVKLDDDRDSHRVFLTCPFPHKQGKVKDHLRIT